MAFTRSTFTKLAGGARQVHYYSTADAIGTVVASGYFNDATNDLKAHDIILAVSSNTGTHAVDMLVVTSVTSAATVTVTNGT
jgi:hypothetical protein